MKDPLTEGLKEAGEVLKKVYTDFMKIYEREDKSEDKPNLMLAGYIIVIRV